MELYSVLYARLNGSGVWGRMDTCICMAESLCCSPETITTLLISYAPIQNKKFNKLEKNSKLINYTLMAESEEELKSLLMKVKEESEKVGLKLNTE